MYKFDLELLQWMWYNLTIKEQFHGDVRNLEHCFSCNKIQLELNLCETCHQYYCDNCINNIAHAQCQTCGSENFIPKTDPVRCVKCQSPLCSECNKKYVSMEQSLCFYCFMGLPKRRFYFSNGKDPDQNDSEGNELNFEFQQQFIDLITESNKCIGAHDTRGEIRLYREVLKHMDRSDIWGNLANALYEVGEKVEALDAIRHSFGGFEELVANNKVFQGFKRNLRNWVLFGVLLHEQKFYSQAEQAYLQVLKIDPNNRINMKNLEELYQHTENSEKLKQIQEKIKLLDK